MFFYPVPNRIQAFGENFEVSSEKRSSCIRLKVVQDNFVDPVLHFPLMLTRPDDILVEFVRPSLDIEVGNTKGMCNSNYYYIYSIYRKHRF